MLIRFGGGSGGIKEYLEEGQKQGRGQSRDELDERVILAGDLETLDALIESFESQGDKYLHITLSFREDEVSRELLENVVRDFEKFAMSAYRSDEYAFYAEAHMPRVMSYHNAQSGELVERKPHIHIVIPKVNLLTGGHLNPFGLVEQNLQYVDAFQEHINEKYGLASPKDHRRVEFTSESEMLSRYKGDLFDSQGKELKAQLLEAVLERGITRHADFVSLLREFGEHRTRNAGKADEYENLKVAGAARGVNLKDFVFRREFIELSTADKRARLAEEFGPRYESPGQPRCTSADRSAALEAWASVRAREIKYINGGNRRAWQAWREADGPTRLAILASREARFYAKHDHQQEQPDGRRTDPTRDPTGGRWDRAFPLKGPKRGRGRAEHERPGASGQHDLGTAPSLAQTESLDDLRDLSSVPVVSLGEAGPVLLPGDAVDHLEHREAQHADSLRRGDALPGELSRAAAGPVNPAGQRLRDLQRQREELAGDQAQAWRDMKRQIGAKELLAELATSHGVLVEKYTVVPGRDGSDRIRCGSRHLNVSDFLTRELHLPWAEAQRILREAHVRQQSAGVDQQMGAAPSPHLWREFMGRRRQILAADRAAGQHQAKLDSAKGRAAITRAFQAARTKANSLPPSQRRAQISIARMTRLVAEAELRDRLRQKRVQTRALGQRSDLALYKQYLQEKAQFGDEAALGELRRVTGLAAAAPGQPGNGILGSPDSGEMARRAGLYAGAGLTYTVESNGDVTYKVGGARVLRDTARKIDVLAEDAKTVETALRLAQQKFGSTLTLSGSRRFQDKVAKAAAEHRLSVRFTDERLNQVMAAHRDSLNKARGPGKPVQRGPDRG